ncbi:histone family protein [Candidatus Woesearchaeota archaeon]|nr:histone family protein [Candidatus Woesearchaeota archaeon]HIH37366.1 histone family protein [Candidatus Woesearchaeota archaeon]HIH48611.1 histone family protein [Candidatus Woesearchaeota archaeon]HIJ03609.1 histone family protein [Candidatus Woesearchaeota archaeon]
MSRATQTIPLAPLGRILQNAGAKRVSQDAMEEFSSILTSIGEDIASKALLIAKHAGRKTIHDGDIKIAAKTM